MAMSSKRRAKHSIKKDKSKDHDSKTSKDDSSQNTESDPESSGDDTDQDNGNNDEEDVDETESSYPTTIFSTSSQSTSANSNSTSTKFITITGSSSATSFYTTSRQSAPVSLNRTLISQTSVGSTYGQQSNFLRQTESRDKTTTLAVSVTVSALVVGGIIIAMILYRRFRAVKLKERVYSRNACHAVPYNKDGFTNFAYSKDGTMEAYSDGIYPHSGDCGFPDRGSEGNIDNAVNDYHTANFDTEVVTKSDGDDYYSIKENVGTEYNKIAFSPRVIPEDLSYGHIHLLTRLKDKTYDHLNEGLQGTKSLKCEVYEEDSYSHLNQSKTDTGHTSPIKTTDINSDCNEEGTAHPYSILEEENSPIQADFQNDEEAHKYFVLDKEFEKETTLKNMKKKTEGYSGSNPVVKHTDRSSDHTYFENCQLGDATSAIHLYQGMEPHDAPDDKNEVIDIGNHDYFILEK